MNATQKVIKYCAIAFAIFLIVSIFSGIFYGVYGLFTFGNGFMNNQNIEEKCHSAEEHCLQISLAASNLSIKTGDSIKVDTKNDKINTTVDGDRLILAEKDRHVFDDFNNREVTLYLPEGISYDKIYISGGAGNINIDTLRAKDLEMSLGVGSTEINVLEVENAKISTGIGDTKINTLEIKDAKISAGIGETSVGLKSKAEEYSIKVSRGIGKITFNGSSVSDDGTIGNGAKKLDISGGIGAVNIRTAE